MKKFVLGIALLIGLAGCGSDKKDEALIKVEPTTIEVNETGTFEVKGNITNNGTLVTLAGNALVVTPDKNGNFISTVQMNDIIDSADLVAKYNSDEQTVKIKFDTSKYEEALQVSSSKAVSNSSTENSKATTQSSEKLPSIAEDQMASFIDYLKTDLPEKGVDISSYTFYNRDNMLYINVPNDYKYYDKTDLQEFADGIQSKEHEAFNVWAAMNGVDYNSYPKLFIKTEDGESLASQKMNGSMELKVK